MQNPSTPVEDIPLEENWIFVSNGHNELDDLDDELNNSSNMYSPISVMPQAVLPPPLEPPVKTHAELKELAHEIMQFLLTYGAQVQAPEVFLLRAASLGYIEIAKISILAGANIHTQQEGKSALTIAQLAHHTEIVSLINNATMAQGPTVPLNPIEVQINLHKTLTDFAKNVVSYPNIPFGETKQIFNILRLIGQWSNENEDGQVSTLFELRQNIVNEIRAFSTKVATSIFQFVLTADSRPLWEICIEAGMPFNNAQNHFRKTPLHLAAENNQLDIARLLLSRGADVNSQEAPGKDSPLILAVRQGHPHMVALLLENGAKPQLQNDAKQSAEGLASIHPDHKFTTRLIAPRLLSNTTKPKGITAEQFIEQERTHLKHVIALKREDHIAVHQMLQGLCEQRRQDIERWKTWQDTPQGQDSMKNLQLEFLDLLHHAPSDRRYEIYKVAQTFGYTQIIDTCRFLGIGTSPSPLLLSQTRMQQDHTPTSSQSPVI